MKKRCLLNPHKYCSLGFLLAVCCFAFAWLILRCRSSEAPVTILPHQLVQYHIIGRVYRSWKVKCDSAQIRAYVGSMPMKENDTAIHVIWQNNISIPVYYVDHQGPRHRHWEIWCDEISSLTFSWNCDEIVRYYYLTPEEYRDYAHYNNEVSAYCDRSKVGNYTFGFPNSSADYISVLEGSDNPTDCQIEIKGTVPMYDLESLIEIDCNDGVCTYEFEDADTLTFIIQNNSEDAIQATYQKQKQPALWALVGFWGSGALLFIFIGLSVYYSYATRNLTKTKYEIWPETEEHFNPKQYQSV